MTPFGSEGLVAIVQPRPETSIDVNRPGFEAAPTLQKRQS